MKPRKIPFILSGVSLAILLASCGGGGGGDTTTLQTPSATTSSVSGTVPGTLIEAFCADGTYYKVNSTNNGTAQHPFILVLPTAVDCRLVMTTNEDDLANRVITSIQINSGLVTSGLMNLNGDVDLGYVPLSVDPSTIDDGNNDGVKDTPLVIAVNSSSLTVRSVSYDPLDKDGDDIPDLYNDDDNDGDFNRDDTDYVSDGDSDHDGIDDTYDRDDDNDGVNETSTTAVSSAPVANYSLSTGRLLVSQCAQCHGTNGRSVTRWDSITDEANELASEMFDEDGIMLAQAHGYTSAEISEMASWLGAQPNVSGDNSDGDDD